MPTTFHLCLPQEIRRRSGRLCFVGLQLLLFFLLGDLFYLLDDDGTIRYQGRNRANCCQHRQEHSADHAQREWNLDQGFALLVLDDDAANVALMHQLFDFGDQVGAADFLALLSQWGQIATSCDFGAGGVGVDVGEFLEFLASWGPCP